MNPIFTALIPAFQSNRSQWYSDSGYWGGGWGWSWT
jgi:hypothetical protein